MKVKKDTKFVGAATASCRNCLWTAKSGDGIEPTAIARLAIDHAEDQNHTTRLIETVVTTFNLSG